MSSKEVVGRQPKCARCRNHGKVVVLKSHKRFCEFKRCSCGKCILTVQRRLIMAQQVRLSREQAQDLGHAVKPNLPSPPPPPPDASPAAQHTPNADKYQASLTHNFTQQNKGLPPEVDAGSYSLEQKNALRTLMNKYEFPVDALPLLLIVLQAAEMDLKRVVGQIRAAKQEVSVVELSKEYVLISDLNWSYQHRNSSLCPTGNYVFPYRPYALAPLPSQASHSPNLCVPIPTMPYYPSDHQEPSNRKPWMPTLFTRSI